MNNTVDHTDLLATLRTRLEREGVQGITTLLILGSGMGGIIDRSECTLLVERSDTGVEGHGGRIVVWHASTGPVLVSLGRRHLYEGYSVGEARLLVDVAAGLGVRSLVTTNAAGGLNPRLATGDLMLITDYTATTLARFIGASSSRGRRESFALELYDGIERASFAHGVALQRGVYAGVPGPSYETRAEVRMLRRMGADAVGMSTVPEVMAAADNGMRTVGVSLITNLASEQVQQTLDHSHVVDESRRAEERLRAVVGATLVVLGGTHPVSSP